jgi:hypothetical protein
MLLSLEPLREAQKEIPRQETTAMKKLISAFALIAASVCLCAGGVAQSDFYVLTNNVNTGNSATLFNLNHDGSLSPVQTFATGGEAVEGGYYAGVTQLISPGGACIFVADGDSNDIAAFSKSTGYSKVGNYSNSALEGASNMPMVLNSAGTLLYAAYELSSNLAVWTVNQDCSLTLANYYSTEAFLGDMVITHDGSTLLCVYVLAKEAGSFTISGSTLTNNGTVSTASEVTSIAVTNDDTTVVMGTGYLVFTSTIVTASLPGFTHQKKWTVGPGYSAASIALSPAAAGGHGCLYIGNTGSGSVGQAGITGATFTESPLNLAYVNNVISPVATYIGTVATIENAGNGGGVYAAEVPGYVGVYTADSSCAVTLEAETLDPYSTFVLSVSSWERQ